MDIANFRNKMGPIQTLIDMAKHNLENMSDDQVPIGMMYEVISKAQNRLDALCEPPIKLSSVRKCGNCAFYNPPRDIQSTAGGIQVKCGETEKSCQLDEDIKPDPNHSVCDRHSFGLRRD